ncbi:TIGR03089 family protein [Brachybacterium sp. AOP29-B2-41]|uniref:TIGR03089 family protein n=1 Tax=Brachybacterium sp. AOP29-B2-41 TaxID=3457704 RepID=UPI004033F110
MSEHRTPSMDTGAQLLRALEQTGPNPVLAWYGEASRIELSGHVLANWVIKAIGHLHDEIALAPGDQMVLDLPPHWKRLVLALAAWSLGAEVTWYDREGSAGDAAGTGDAVLPVPSPQVVATDRPDSELAESADEVLALQAVSLAPRYDGELPALVHDWLSEVRGSSDRLGVALPRWSGPAPLEPAVPQRPSTAHGTPLPRVLVEDDGLPAAAQLLGALLAGGGIVGPASAVGEHQEREEGVTERLRPR